MRIVTQIPFYTNDISNLDFVERNITCVIVAPSYFKKRRVRFLDALVAKVNVGESSWFDGIDFT